MLLTGRIPALPPFWSLRPDLPACTVGISPEGHDERPGTHPSRLVHAARILRFKLECEQELWAECSRLIANCIIFYNASILSRLLEHQEEVQARKTRTETARATTWAHKAQATPDAQFDLPDLSSPQRLLHSRRCERRFRRSASQPTCLRRKPRCSEDRPLV
jgi:hypothetical protein